MELLARDGRGNDCDGLGMLLLRLRLELEVLIPHEANGLDMMLLLDGLVLVLDGLMID